MNGGNGLFRLARGEAQIEPQADGTTLITFHLVGDRPSGRAGGALLAGGGPLDVCDLATKETPERRLVPPGSRLCPVNDRAKTRNDPLNANENTRLMGRVGGNAAGQRTRP